MKTLILTRHIIANGAVIGVMSGLPKTLYTLELEWRNNQSNISCIPTGTYRCIPHGWEKGSRAKFAEVWELLDVPNRNGILFHPMNTIKDTRGCIGAGMVFSCSQTQARIDDSRMALDYMRQQIGQDEFTLTIK